MNTIVKATTKGQITIPISWRKRFNTDRFFVDIKDSYLEIRPINLEDVTKKKEYTIFDAIRDNSGKGLKAKDLLKTIKKTL
ncbi:MAG: AbrB/MazE/SpoVT family DNA-binding domain-containing protein [Candidatus Magasanikbacteria bacterium]|nr:AbrB/MazE/SpoVT family DNA-binding domain-containing protein [Candidatus Magasanikbacteria bacterium]